MRHLRWLLALAAICAFGAHAAVPAKFSYQGFLTTPGGNPISASLAMTFSLWDDPTAGSQAWTESQTVAVNAGHFNVILGNLTPIAAVFDKPYYLQVQVGSDPAMTPRQPLTSVPYAAASGLPGCSAGDLINCYTGPAGTLGVGACKTGTRSCTSSGTYGPCTGQVTPTSEAADGVDNDCDGTIDNGALANGAACGSPASCASGFCVDGICSNSPCAGACQSPNAAFTGGSNGVCAPVTAGTDPHNACAGAYANCDGSTTSCPTTCSSGAVCGAGYSCVSNQCVLAGSPNGAACAAPANCTSGFCVDGICSNTACTGACQSPNASYTGGANGTCTLVQAGTDPHNACSAPYANCSGSSASCPTSCATDAVCATNSYCDGANACVPKNANGSACSAVNQCTSGFCVDGVCCNSGCTGSCAACDVAGNLGSCTNIPAGTDPDNECPSVSCSSFYYGWIGNTCYRKADVSGAQAACSGSAACRSNASECALQTNAGTAGVTCDPSCQTPNLATCTGGTAGICTTTGPCI